MNLGENLRYILEQHNLTQKELATKLSITPSALGNYIQGTREPDYHTLIRIADYFHVTTDFLLGHNVKRDALTHKEEILLHLFRTLNKEQQEFYLEQGKLFIRLNNKKTSSLSENKEKTAG